MRLFISSSVTKQLYRREFYLTSAGWVGNDNNHVSAVWMNRPQNVSIITSCRAPNWTCFEVRSDVPGLYNDAFSFLQGLYDCHILVLKFISLCLSTTSDGTDYARSSTTRILFWSLQFTTYNDYFKMAEDIHIYKFTNRICT